MNIPRIGITLGDPGGIGPEIIIKALAQKSALPEAHYVLYGCSFILKEEEKALGIKLDYSSFSEKEKPDRFLISLYEIKTPLKSIKRGKASRENGLASFFFFKRAVEEARRGKIQALVTGPVSKQSWSLAGIEWLGHTDYLEHFYPQAIMAFWSKELKVALLSHHLPLKKALRKVKKEYLLKFFQDLQKSLKKIDPARYQFLVAGLNPHAGESGLLGKEEEEEIMPAVREAKQRGMNIRGPLAPDIVFREALGHSDRIVISLYHDQGLIAFKLKAFEIGVNLTLGIPFVRTSPDHGTAFDVAGKRMASPRSLIEAIKLAYELSSGSF